MLGGCALHVSYVANWLLGLETPAWMPETYVLAAHGATINVCAYGTFLVVHEVKENHTHNCIYTSTGDSNDGSRRKGVRYA